MMSQRLVRNAIGKKGQCGMAMSGLRKDFRRFLSVKPPTSKSPIIALFQGKLSIPNIFPYPVQLDETEKETVRSLGQSIEEFYRTENDAPANDRTCEIPEAVRKKMAAFGCYGMLVPEEFGGLGLNNVQYARFCEITGYHDLAIGVHLAAHQSIGYKGIMLYGTQEQKVKYLPKLAAGQWIAAYCLTEPGSGSDAQSIQTRATEEKNGDFLLDGTKIWISNGGYADFFTVFARLDRQSSDNKEGEGPLCAFLVEKSFGNIECSKPEKKMGIKGSNTVAVTFNGTRVPRENLLGGVGEGFQIAVNILNNGRHGLAAATCGAVKRALDEAKSHAKTRKQFKTEIIKFGVIQEKISDMMVSYYINQSMSYHIAALIDQSNKSKIDALSSSTAEQSSGESNNSSASTAPAIDFSNESALAKVYGSESAWNSIDDAIQVLGGMGYMQECELERMLRDMRIFRIFEGTNDILRLLVARNGLKTLGADIKSSMKDPREAMRILMGGNNGGNRDEIRKSFADDLTDVVHPELSDLVPEIADAVSQFHSSASDILKKYRKDLIKHQYIVEKFGDMALRLYAVLVCLSRCTRSLENQSPNADKETMIVRKAVSDQLKAMRSTLDSLEDPRREIMHTIPEIACMEDECLPVEPVYL